MLVTFSIFFLLTFRISVRAFTKLFDEKLEECVAPLYTDTFLSVPFTTHAGILYGCTEGN